MPAGLAVAPTSPPIQPIALAVGRRRWRFRRRRWWRQSEVIGADLPAKSIVLGFLAPNFCVVNREKLANAAASASAAVYERCSSVVVRPVELRSATLGAAAGGVAIRVARRTVLGRISPKDTLGTDDFGCSKSRRDRIPSPNARGAHHHSYTTCGTTLRNWYGAGLHHSRTGFTVGSFGHGFALRVCELSVLAACANTYPVELRLTVVIPVSRDATCALWGLSIAHALRAGAARALPSRL